MTYLVSSLKSPELQQNQWVRELDGSIQASVTTRSNLQLLSRQREKATSAIYLFEFELALLEMHYFLEEKVAIQRFLRRHSFLIQILLEASNKIEAYFHESQAFLNIAVDYEVADNSSKEVNNEEELVISISTSMPSQEAIEQLKLFYSNWWSRASKEAKGKISIGLECL